MVISFTGRPPLSAGDTLSPGTPLITKESGRMVARSWIGPVTCLHVQTTHDGLVERELECTMVLDVSRAYEPPVREPSK